MKTVESADAALALPIERVQTTLQEHPVEVAILFGSHATNTQTTQSDIDIAIAFEELRSSDTNYNTEFFGVSADLSDTLETDDVDFIDLHSMSPELVEAVFEHGVLLVGTEATATRLRQQLTESGAEGHPPRDRLDTALAQIDEHLDTDPATSTTPASGGPDDG
ncbi:nucleotidyltransferase domain-containing protein [Halococcus sp. PRR34]|uniref:type VII toxin-antitoxin system MntA family adenylyltransferase antitoxin n=1 Tax=Halococcus sp. PRR34 TaxID=3020830 RepID=UPI0023600F90|nr:nucleotidyltransferase domain-containing protein [Halococcus sp. PRR34]